MFHMRMHEYGPKFPRVRVWTDNDRGFKVITNEDAHDLKRILDKIGIESITLHHCDTDESCKCRPLASGQPIE